MTEKMGTTIKLMAVTISQFSAWVAYVNKIMKRKLEKTTNLSTINTTCSFLLCTILSY